MRTPASIANRPIHPMLIALPIGLWIFSLSDPLAGSAVGLSVVTIVLLGIGGWLGGELVYVHRVGVAEGGTPSARPETRQTEPVAGRRRIPG